MKAKMEKVAKDTTLAALRRASTALYPPLEFEALKDATGMMVHPRRQAVLATTA